VVQAVITGPMSVIVADSAKLEEQSEPFGSTIWENCDGRGNFGRCPMIGCLKSWRFLSNSAYALLGSAQRSRTYWSQSREITLRVLTHNIMLLWCE